MTSTPGSSTTWREIRGSSERLADPAYAEVRRDLEGELSRLQQYYGDSEELARRFVETDLKK